MGVYISGLEMPKEGEWISLNISPNGKCFIQSWCGKDFNFAEKLTAAPVPPHGRLGDLDALAESVRNPGIFPPVVSSEVLVFLRNAPTIIPAEEGET